MTDLTANPQPEKTAPGGWKTASGSPGWNPDKHAYRIDTEALKSCRESWPAATTTASGVSVYGFRYYDPEAGRWLGRDPIGEMGGMNIYGFIGNRTVNTADYLGFQSIGPFSPSDAMIVANQRFGEIAKKFVAGTSDKDEYHYRDGDAWTVALKAMPPYDRLRTIVLKSRGVQFCEQGPIQFSGNWDVRAVDWGDEGGAGILQAIADGVNYVFGFELKSIGGVEGVFTITNIDCSKCELTYKFEAGPGSFRFGSLTRVNEHSFDPKKLWPLGFPGGLVGLGITIPYAGLPTNQADNPFGTDGPFATIDIYWSWEETIKF